MTLAIDMRSIVMMPKKYRIAQFFMRWIYMRFVCVMYACVYVYVCVFGSWRWIGWMSEGTRGGWVKWVNQSDRVYLWSLKIDFLICLTYLFYELSSFRCGCFRFKNQNAFRSTTTKHSPNTFKSSTLYYLNPLPVLSFTTKCSLLPFTVL